MLRFLIFVWIIIYPFNASAAELWMVEEEGCPWCEKWDEEIAPIYPKTNEGKFAPLARIDIADTRGDPRFSKALIYTPTFVLVLENQEVARIEGYPGEDFFWALLHEALVEYSDYGREEE